MHMEISLGYAVVSPVHVREISTRSSDQKRARRGTLVAEVIHMQENTRALYSEVERHARFSSDDRSFSPPCQMSGTPSYTPSRRRQDNRQTAMSIVPEMPRTEMNNQI